MRKRLYLLCAVVFAAACLSPVVSNAQQPSNYLFLEVLDSQGAPVVDATVKAAHRDSSDLKTYEDGRVQFPIPYSVRDFTGSFFTIAKAGFFDYYDLGLTPSGYETRGKLELLKIPQTEDERKLLGNEQSKREFLWAAKTGDAVAVSKLLKVGFDPNLTTGDLRNAPAPKNIPAIVFAALSGDKNTVEALIKAGVSIRVKDEPVHSILAYYLNGDPFKRHPPKTEAEKQKLLKIYEEGAEMLVKAGADVNAPSPFRYKENTLMTAASGGYARIVKLLLDKGLKVNEMGGNGTVLMYAVNDYPIGRDRSKIDVVNLLLKRGADPNLKNAEGDYCTSPLMLAASVGDVAVLNALVKAGAKVNHSCRNSYPAISWAINAKKAEAVRFLLNAGSDRNFVSKGYADQSLFIMAAENGNNEIVKIMVEKGFPIESKDRFGRTALFYAIEKKDFAMIDFLLDAGANPNSLTEDIASRNGCSTPLMVAAQRGDVNILRALIVKKADVGLLCKNGQSTLTAAASADTPVFIMKFLIENGADAKSEQGLFALDYIRNPSNYVRDREAVIKFLETARAK